MSQFTQILVELVLCPWTLTGGAFGSITSKLIFKAPSSLAKHLQLSLIARRKCEAIYARNFGYDLSVRPPLRTVDLSDDLSV